MRTGKRFNGRFVMVLAALVLLVAAAYAGSQQPKGAPFSTEIMKVKEGLYVIPGYDGAATGGNVAVRLTSEGVIIVDSKLPTLYSDIVNKVKSVSPQPIKYLLNTHQHGDHTGSNAQFATGTEILMHRNARANMLKGNLPGPGRIVYTDQQSVFLGGVEVQMHYMGRGHTNGDSVIYFPDLRTVHTGDLVVWGKRSQGTVLTPNMDYAAGNGSGTRSTLRVEREAADPAALGRVRRRHGATRRHHGLRRRALPAQGHAGGRQGAGASGTVDRHGELPPARLGEADQAPGRRNTVRLRR